MIIFFIISLLFPYSASAQTTTENKLWNNETLQLDVTELQQKLMQVQLTPEEGQKIGTCIQALTPRLQAAAGQTPDAQLQRDISDCYRGTQIEALLTPVYQKIATVVECGKDKLGVERVADVSRLAQSPTDREIEILKQCYIERTAPVVAAAAAVNVFAMGGARNVGLLLYVGATHTWFFIRQRRRDRFGVVINSLSKIPVDLAIVRLAGQDGRVTKTTVTDQNGKFYLFAKPGEYKLSVTKPGFEFPSQFSVAPSDAFASIVHNEPHVNVTQQSPVLQYTLPADPQVQEPNVAHEKRKRIGRAAGSFVAALSPLAGIGTAVASPKWWVILFAALNIGLFFAFRYFAARLKPRAFGIVRDNAGKPCADAIVRVSETQYNKLVATAVTDGAGRYGAMVGRGTYAVKYEKPGVGSTERMSSINQDVGVIADYVTIS